MPPYEVIVGADTQEKARTGRTSAEWSRVMRRISPAPRARGLEPLLRAPLRLRWTSQPATRRSGWSPASRPGRAMGSRSRDARIQRHHGRSMTRTRSGWVLGVVLAALANGCRSGQVRLPQGHWTELQKGITGSFSGCAVESSQADDA